MSNELITMENFQISLILKTMVAYFCPFMQDKIYQHTNQLFMYTCVQHNNVGKASIQLFHMKIK